MLQSCSFVRSSVCLQEAEVCCWLCRAFHLFVWYAGGVCLHLIISQQSPAFLKTCFATVNRSFQRLQEVRGRGCRTTRGWWSSGGMEPRNTRYLPLLLPSWFKHDVDVSVKLQCEALWRFSTCFSVSIPKAAGRHRQLSQHPLQGETGRKLYVLEESYDQRHPHRPEVSTLLL